MKKSLYGCPYSVAAYVMSRKQVEWIDEKFSRTRAAGSGIVESEGDDDGAVEDSHAGSVAPAPTVTIGADERSGLTPV
ncbi:hypothetical protein GCM10027435_13500 [Haloparvum alkalitolerans]